MYKKLLCFLALAATLCLSPAPGALAQTRTGTEKSSDGRRLVKGFVYDEDGEPLFGTVIIENGTNNAVTAGKDGSYSITVKDDPKTSLYVSFIGMSPQNVEIGGKNRIDFNLKSDQMLRNAEIVATGYGDVQRDAYTGSATVLTAQAVSDRIAGTLDAALAGLVPGMSVSGSGQPGDVMDMTIRGIGSIDGSSNPLYVVDGMVIDSDNMSGHSNAVASPIATLNPDDIESVTVLKDAASASLYGSQGANGVIVITTKQGRPSDRVRYSFSAQAGASRVSSFALPNLVSSEEYRDLWTMGEFHRLVQGAGGEFIPNLYSLYEDKLNNRVGGYNYYQWNKLAQQNFNTLFAIPQPDGSLRQYDFFGEDADKLPHTDWWDLVTRTAAFQKYSLSLSGGSNSIRYYMSAGYLDQEGVIINSRLTRINYTSQLSYDDKKKFINWGAKLNVSRTEQSGPLTSGSNYNMPHYAALLLPSVIPAYLEDGSYNFNFPNNLLNSTHNPVASAKENIRERPQFSLQSQAWMRLNFRPWLNFRFDINDYYITGYRRDYFDKDFGSGYGAGGDLTEFNSKRTKITLKGFFNINLTFKNRHRINGTAGLEGVQFKHMNVTAGATQFASDEKPYLSNGSIFTASGNGYEYGSASFVSRIDYSYRYRYFVGASFRRDGSSRFSPENRWGNFWSVSGAYRITNENWGWMKAVRKYFSNIKFKGSYGTNGKIPSVYYQWMNTYGGTGVYDNNQAFSQTFRPTEDLRWERNTMMNVGVDATGFGNRIKFTAEYYIRDVDDLIQDVPVSRTTGFTTVKENTTAGIRNKGFEFEIKAAILSGGPFKWDISANLATLDSRYYGLESDVISGSHIRRNGESVYAWYTLEYGGVDPNTGEVYNIAYDADGNRIKANSENPSIRRIVGKGLPSVTGALTNTLSWHGFTLTANFTYAAGHKIFDSRYSSRTGTDGRNIVYNIDRRQLDAWTPDNPFGTERRRINSQLSAGGSTRFMHKGDYIKLKNLSLAYTFPASTFRRWGISGATVFAQGENLFVLTELEGYDPDMWNNGNLATAKYPTATSVTAGLRFNF